MGPEDGKLTVSGTAANLPETITVSGRGVKAPQPEEIARKIYGLVSFSPGSPPKWSQFHAFLSPISVINDTDVDSFIALFDRRVTEVNRVKLVIVEDRVSVTFGHSNDAEITSFFTATAYDNKGHSGVASGWFKMDIDK